MAAKWLLKGVSLPFCLAILLSGCVQATPTPLNGDVVTVENPASLFHLTVPEPSVSSRTIDITAWFLLSPGSAGRLPKIKNISASVDEENKTISVTGLYNTFELAPGKNLETSPSSPSVATQSISATASSPGTYIIQIEAQNFVSQLPQTYGPSGEILTPPQPMASASITFE